MSQGGEYEVNVFWIKAFRALAVYTLVLIIAAAVINRGGVPENPYIKGVVAGLAIGGLLSSATFFIVSILLKSSAHKIAQAVTRGVWGAISSWSYRRLRLIGILGAVTMIASALFYIASTHFIELVYMLIGVSAVIMMAGVYMLARGRSGWRECIIVAVFLAAIASSYYIAYAIAASIGIHVSAITGYTYMPLTILGILITGLAVMPYVRSYNIGLYSMTGRIMVSASALSILALFLPLVATTAGTATWIKTAVLIASGYLHTSFFMLLALAYAMTIEVILDRTESYAFGTVYTIIMLLLAIYVIQALTVYSTVSIIADTIASLRYVLEKPVISIDEIDRIGLLLISPKILSILFIIIGIAYVAGVILVKPRQGVSQVG